MSSPLNHARRYAETVRFSGDVLRGRQDETGYRTDMAREFALHSGLGITRDTTPALHKPLLKVCNRLQIPQSAVEAFAYASPEIQAECYPGTDANCVIRFSSSLITLLSPQELQFVIGHELGHFLFAHGQSRSQMERQSLEYFMYQRAQEISADRLGVIACGSLEVAIKAIIKSISGLGDKYLRFDVRKFLDQLKGSSGNLSSMSAGSSHPSMLLRARALMWFSLVYDIKQSDSKVDQSKLSKADSRIQKDLDKHADGAVKAIIEEAKSDLDMWLIAQEIISDGVFSKGEQEDFADQFGDDTLLRLKSMLEEMSISETKRVIEKRIRSAKHRLQSITPIAYSSKVAKG